MWISVTNKDKTLYHQFSSFFSLHISLSFSHFHFIFLCFLLGTTLFPFLDPKKMTLEQFHNNTLYTSCYDSHNPNKVIYASNSSMEVCGQMGSLCFTSTRTHLDDDGYASGGGCSDDKDDTFDEGFINLKEMNGLVQSKVCSRGHWRPAEDSKLKELVALYGPQNWNLIAEKLQGRSGTYSYI